jgi:hypothetical protein
VSTPDLTLGSDWRRQLVVDLEERRLVDEE